MRLMATHESIYHSIKEVNVILFIYLNVVFTYMKTIYLLICQLFQLRERISKNSTTEFFVTIRNESSRGHRGFAPSPAHWSSHPRAAGAPDLTGVLSEAVRGSQLETNKGRFY